MNRIILAGGSGYLGMVLAEYYKDKVTEIIILTRGKNDWKDNIRWVHWDGQHVSVWSEWLEGSDLLVNLTGKNVNCRYTEENKNEIISSRVNATNVLGEVLLKLKNPPKVWIQCVSSTIYRDSRDKYMDEFSGELGEGFSVNVCEQWEEAFEKHEIPGVRKVALRISFVLGRNGGAFPTLHNLARLGLGGKQGDGQQYVSWIHEKDFARIVQWGYENEKIKGVYNCTAPNPVTNEVMMFGIRKVAGIPVGLPSPECLIKVGAFLIGTEPELALKSRKVVPAKLLNEGFRFEYNQIDVALADLING
ncbi:MAG: TIGR01777 family oxidoreductase [Sporocytophaga sp.]|uniref:TIGR01777 family oxidoreductase n=1 Tax=Sporocytophaga sp. TaxID=2231183 RepID=UPI001B04F18A|nr:TIGR01777 family oxidoreductase [Sporocytophaga sp.]MBO9702650.1 TIGR01777 family oxidoreductase [Sporocytophaga sp.]